MIILGIEEVGVEGSEKFNVLGSTAERARSWGRLVAPNSTVGGLNSIHLPIHQISDQLPQTPFAYPLGSISVPYFSTLHPLLLVLPFRPPSSPQFLSAEPQSFISSL